eukprot:1721050-Rhodomonas_salina.1
MLTQRQGHCLYVSQRHGVRIHWTQCRGKPFNFHCSHYSLPTSYAMSLRQNSMNSATDAYVL